MSKYLPTQPKERPPGGSGQPLLPEEVSQPAATSADRAAPPISQEQVSEHPGGLNRQGHVIVALLVLSILSYYLFSRFVITAVVVQGHSMSPTLQDGSRYLLNRITLRFREPRRGDLVVIRDLSEEDLAVKRIVALPGETIEVRDGRVFVNSQPLEEPYLPPNIRTYSPEWRSPPLELRKDRFFVLGDNRPSSEDSRSYGPLSREQLVGLLVK